jgi:hypothetical protein
MYDNLLCSKEAARRLGISRACLYEWLGQSDAGAFMIRGQPVTIDYLQGGAKGQGRIQIAAVEVERLKDLMRVRPRKLPSRRLPDPHSNYPGITVKLGRPGQ